VNKRSCAACGKEKELEGGKICEKGHFVCSACIGHPGIIFDDRRKKCPLDGTKLN